MLPYLKKFVRFPVGTSLLSDFPGRPAAGGAKGHYKGLWIGLHRGKDDIFRWVDGTDITYTNWDVDEPKLSSQSMYCVMHGSGTEMWQLDYCGTRRWFICKAPKIPNPTIPNTKLFEMTKCNFTGPSVYRDKWVLHNDYCYLVREEAKYSWDMAVNFCRDNDGHLASVHSFDETDFMLLAVTLTSNMDYWIGLSSRYVDSSFEWSDGTPVDFLYWPDSYTQNVTDNMNLCVTFNNYRGFWSTEHCNHFMGVICKRGLNDNFNLSTQKPTPSVPGNCEPGWYSLGNWCYKLKGKMWSQRKSWDEAILGCEEEGGNLASIHNAEQDEFLTDIILNANSNIWIGLELFNQYSKLFKWSDDSPLDYTNWFSDSDSLRSSQTSYKLCTTKAKTRAGVGKWINFACSVKYPYLCQKLKNSSLTQPSEDPFACPNITGWIRLGNSCFNIFEQKLPWIEAQKICGSFGANLLNFRNSAYFYFFQKRLAKDNFYWIGIRQSSANKFTDMDGGVATDTNWLGFQPLRVSQRPMDNCVAMNSDTKWVVKNCQEMNSFGCEWKPGVSKQKEFESEEVPEYQVCPNISSWTDMGGNYCYLFQPYLQLSWGDAVKYCFLHGGHLASFHSEKEIYLALQDIRSNSRPIQILYIGLGKMKSGSYGWIDRSPFDFTYWEENPKRYGASDCVQMNVESGKWSEAFCEQKRNFICSTPKIKIPEFTSEELTNDIDEYDVSQKLAAGGIFGIVVCVGVVLAIIGVASYYMCPATRMRVQLLETDPL